MRDFIDVSVSPSDREKPYLVCLFEDGCIASVTRYTEVAEVAAYCKQYALPVISSEPRVRAELYRYGVRSGPPLVRARGG